MRFRTMKLDFFDSVEKSGIDSLTQGPKLARNRKMQLSIFLENISLKASVRPLNGIYFGWFRLISSMNIDNLDFAFFVIPCRSRDARFRQKYEVEKTLQNLSKMQNVDAFATSKTSKYSISHVFYRLFRLLGFVAERLWDELVNSVSLFYKKTLNMRFSS